LKVVKGFKNQRLELKNELKKELGNEYTR
jgi:uncharacterized protein YdcH (DUF465 family)